jgi:hypothetical protein
MQLKADQIFDFLDDLLLLLLLMGMMMIYGWTF